MEPLKAHRAWAVCYTPESLLEMGEEYDTDRLEQLNDFLGRGNYVLISEDTQGYPGDLVVDFPLSLAEPYRALILLESL